MTISEGVPASITTPDTVKTRLGTLEFRDRSPTPETAERLYSSLQPFFDKSWRPSETEPQNLSSD